TLRQIQPPNCANRTTSEAPNPNPTNWYGTDSGCSNQPKNKNSEPTPSSESATTASPVTAPPRSAICSALFKLVRAAEAVRILARIEQYIPVYPARPEHTAPTRKLITVFKAYGEVLADMWYPTNTTIAKATAIS